MTIEDKLMVEKEELPPVDPKAAKNTAIYAFSFLVMSAIDNPFRHITEPTERAFDISPEEIVYIGIFNAISGIIINPFMPYILSKISLRQSHLISGFIFTVTSLLRLGINRGFTIFFITSFLNGPAFCLLNVGQMAFIKLWHHPERYAKVNPLLKLSQILPSALFALSPFLFINEKEPGKETLLDQIQKYLIFLAIFPAIYFLLVFFFADEQPEKPVFKEQTTLEEAQESVPWMTQVIGTFKILFSWDFQMNCLPYVLTRMGFFISFGCINFFFESIHSTQLLGSLTFMIGTLAGLSGSYFFDIIFSKRIKFGLKIVQVIIIIISATQLVAFQYQHPILLAITYFMIGFMALNQASRFFTIFQQKMLNKNQNVVNMIMLQYFIVFIIGSNFLNIALFDQNGKAGMKNLIFIFGLFVSPLPFLFAK